MNDRSMRFGALDTLRGFAAVAVVIFHVAWLKLSGNLLPHAYLAVDFFFILSGFVIAHSYGEKIGAGLTKTSFLACRLIRLYPMVLAAVALAAIVLTLKAHVDPSRVDPPGRAALGLLCNIFLVPDLFVGSASQGVLFPGNGPLWSVAFEIAINVLWCSWLARLSTRMLVAWTVVCFGFVVLSILVHGDADLGFNWQTLPGGAARIGYGFGCGLLLHRVKDKLLIAHHTVPKLLAAALLVCAFAGPSSAALWDVLCIGAVMPLAVVLGLNGADHPRLDRVLGEMSYPLYAIHFPVLSLASGLKQTMGPHIGSAFLLCSIALVLTLATIATMRLYDIPLRRWIMGRWRAARRPEASSKVVIPPSILARPT